MVMLAAEGVSLTFPLYSPAQRNEALNGVHDDRILLSPAGRILGVHALEDVSLSLKSGDRLALIGANGSGKTTLLQVLAGIIRPDIGRVLVEGACTNLININLGIQHEASGHQNITLRGLAAGHSRRAIEAKRKSIAEFCELGEFLDMPVLTYSAGMKMRLSFAIATAFEPEILLLDEWLGTGDRHFLEKASARMRGFVDRAGILVLATHSTELLQQNCNLALWLSRGRVKRFGGVDEVLSAYLANDQT
jgi:ABC-type polysaccharide/polyol phosphate transport system ATPase subunit